MKLQARLLTLLILNAYDPLGYIGRDRIMQHGAVCPRQQARLGSGMSHIRAEPILQASLSVKDRRLKIFQDFEVRLKRRLLFILVRRAAGKPNPCRTFSASLRLPDRL